MHQIIALEHGGPAVLRHQPLSMPQPKARQVIIRTAFAGVNFVDIYQREGRYPGVQLPLALGIEGAGVIVECGAGVDWKVGDRVAYCTGVLGSYADYLCIDAAHLVRVPESVSLRTAAAVLAQGLTADMLINSVVRLEKNARVLVQAAAGGVGGLLVQWLIKQGMQVVGTASSVEKLDWLQQQGVLAVDYREAKDWVGAAKQHAPQGFDVVFDSVGQQTFADSLSLLKSCGHGVLCGVASGPVAQIEIATLMKKSLTVSRPRLPDYLPNAEVLQSRAARLFDLVTNHHLQVRIHAEYPLALAADAQIALASRSTAGKLLLSTNQGKVL
jgi:NADPH:quinone reductase